MRHAAILALLATALIGCGVDGGPKTRQDHVHPHAHERGKMLLADAGKYHAALTAHLSSQEGNELDIFFETASGTPRPVPLPLESFTAQATTSDGKSHELRFVPAPLDERKADPAGKCSHFVARAGWLKSDDQLAVTAKVMIDGKDVTIEWKDFQPKKYAHHQE